MFHQVTLNVRGDKYYTNTMTLRRCPGTNDRSIFLGMNFPVLGELFIDRDREMFGCIFRYLQDGRTTIRYDERRIALLQREAEYFGLHHLAGRLRTLQPFDGYTTIIANRQVSSTSSLEGRRN